MPVLRIRRYLNNISCMEFPCRLPPFLVIASATGNKENLPTRVLVRVDPAKVDQVLTVLAATANPEFPEEVTVDKPSDALEAQEAA